MTALSYSGADTLSFSSPWPSLALPGRLGQSLSEDHRLDVDRTEHPSDRDARWALAECLAGDQLSAADFLCFFFVFKVSGIFLGYKHAVLGENKPQMLGCFWWPWLHDDLAKKLRVGRQSDKLRGHGSFDMDGCNTHTPNTISQSWKQEKTRPSSTHNGKSTIFSSFPAVPFSAGRICQFSACYPADLRVLNSMVTGNSDVIRTSPIFLSLSFLSFVFALLYLQTFYLLLLNNSYPFLSGFHENGVDPTSS